MEAENKVEEQVADELATIQKQIDQMKLLHSSSTRITASLNLPTVLNAIIESTLALTGSNDCLVYLCEESHRSLSLGTAIGSWAEKESMPTPRPIELASAVLDQAGPVVFDNRTRHSLFDTYNTQQWKTSAIAGFENIEHHVVLKQFYFRDEYEWWDSQWSIFRRAFMERLDPDALEEYKSDVLTVVREYKSGERILSTIFTRYTKAQIPADRALF